MEVRTRCQAVRWAGVVFLLWLAWEAWAGAGKAAEEVGCDPEKLRGLFLRGLTGNLLNPKAAVFYVALLPTFMRPGHGAPLTQALTLGSLHLAVAVLVHSLIVLGGAGAAGVILRRMQGPAMRAMMAGGLVVAVQFAHGKTPFAVDLTFPTPAHKAGHRRRLNR